MLPNSRAWKMLCKLYGTVLQEEWRRRVMEKGAVGYFVDAAKNLHEQRAERVGRGIFGGSLAGVQTIPVRTAAGGLDPLERRMLMTGTSIGTAINLPFAEDPASSGLSRAAVSDHYNATSDVHYWKIDVLAGDQLTVRLDSVGFTTDTHLELRNIADGVLAANDNSGPNNDDQISNYTVQTSGTVYVRASAYSGTGDYTLRIDRGRGLGLESDNDYSNDAISGANTLPLSSSGTNLTAKIAGVVMATQGSNVDEDTFYIGYLKGGTPVSLGLALPSTSTLNGKIQLLDGAGNVVGDTDGSDSDGAYTGNTTAEGNYYVRVTANSGAGADANYILNASIADTASPAVTAVSLPANGTTTANLLFQFDVTVDEELLPASVVASAFELRSAGPNSSFGDADDVIYTLGFRQQYTRGNTVQLYAVDGPLRDGDYRFTMKATVTDVVGNTLDGNGDGTGGDSYVRNFTVDLPAADKGIPFAGVNDDALANATPLPMASDPATPELISGRGAGFVLPANYQDYWSDQDWWSFPAQAGDKIAVHIDSPGSDLDPYVELYNPAGGHVASSDSEGPDSDSYISYYTAPTTGTYYVRVGKYYWSTVSDTYRIGVDVARGADIESDQNYNNASNLGSADAITLTEVGANRKGTVVGQIMANEGSTADVDNYQLGLLTAGNSVELTLRTPAGSTLDGAVRVLDSAGNVLVDQDGNPNDGHFLAQITADGQYYAQVAANSGAGTYATYALDINIGDLVPPTVTRVSGLPTPLMSQTIYQNTVLAQDPLAFFKLADASGTTALDSSPNGLNGTYTGTFTLGATGVFGAGNETAVSVNGAGYMAASSSQFDLRHNVSFSFWVNVDHYTNTWSSLLSKSNTGGSSAETYGVWVRNDGLLEFGTSDGSYQIGQSATQTIKLGQWQHIAGTLDRDAGRMRLYVDGTLVIDKAIRTTDAVSNPSTPLLIGTTLESSGSYSPAAARFNDVAIWGSALGEAALLSPIRAAQWKGDIQSTNQLPATWSVTFSEKLAATAQSLTGVVFHDGHAYTTLSSRSWVDAQAWAEQHGGHLVIVNDATENEWLRATFTPSLSAFWIGATDQVTEGTWLTPDGQPLPYTNWNSGEPNNSGNNEDYAGMRDSGGQWNDYSPSSSLNAVIEFDGTDTDGDGLPDSFDNFPSDPLNGYDVRAAGVDGQFDTNDDVVYHVIGNYDGNQTVNFQLTDGPIAPGQKVRFRVTPSITDLVGNALDGDRDGTAGGTYDLYFNTAALPAGFVYEGQGNDTMATATPLTIVQDPTTPEILYTQQPGIGSIDPAVYQNEWVDNDWWSFTVNAGDRINVRTVIPNGSGSDPEIALFNSSGSQLTVNNSSGPGAEDYLTYTATYTGTYYVRVGKYYWASTPGTYELHIDLARGVQAETDYDYSNAPVNTSANVVTLSGTGTQQSATVAGQIMANDGATQDVDTYNLGALAAGNVLELTVRLPSVSTLVPNIQLFDSAGNVIADKDGTPGGAHFKVTLASGGTYYARVSAVSGAGVMALYVLDITSSDVSAPVVTSIAPVPGQNPSDSLYNAGVMAGNPLLYYRFNEPSGTTVVDASGNHLDGAYAGAVTLGATGVYGTGHDASAAFAGGSASVTAGQLDLQREMSFSFWINVDHFTNTWSPLIYKATASNQRQYALWLNSNGSLYFGTADATGEQSLQTGTGLVTTKKWQHIAGVMDRNDGLVRLYVDGNLVGTATVRSTDAVATPTTAIYVGKTTESSGSYSAPAAQIDDLAIYGSALDESTLLKPYRAASGRGDVNSTNQLLASWTFTFNEKMGSMLQSQAETFQQFGGHYYTKITGRTWEDAQAWAAARGGHLVVLDNAAEQAFLASTFGSTQFWIGVTDRNHEGTWTTYDGVTVPSYTNWNTNEPNSGTNYDYGYQYTDGKWYDGWYTWTMDAVVEFETGDTDGDLKPDSYDALPNDPNNGYEVRGAGNDSIFGTGDDVLYNVWADFDGNRTVNLRLTDGPLPPGTYRFTVFPDVTDFSGNALDGNGDGVGGDAYVQTFVVTAIPTGFVYEGQSNDTPATATPLTLVQDSTTPEIWYTQQSAYGSIDPSFYQNEWADNDWWSFTANAGDRINLRTVIPAGSAADPQVGLYNDAGSQLTVNNSSGPGAEDYLTYTATYTGTYYARVGKYYWSTATGNYELHIDVDRGVQAETDYDYSNGSVNSSANTPALASVGQTRTATVAGNVMANDGATQDFDTYNLGPMNAGETVELTVRLPAMSTLVPIIRLLDSSGNVVPDTDGTPGGAHFKATLVATGTYYAQVYADSGSGATALYVMDVKITDATAPIITNVTRLPAQSPSDPAYAGAVSATNPLLFYRFGEASGTAVVDATSNHIDGVYNGTVALGAAGAYGSGHDTAYEVNAAGHVTADSASLDLTTAVSFSFWLYVDHFTNTWTPLVYKGNTSSSQRTYSLWMNSNGSLYFGSADATGEQGIQTGTGAIGAKRWQHVAAVMDRAAGTIRVYVDGNLIGQTGIRTGAAVSNAATPLMLGQTTESNGAYSRLAGRMDDFALYGSALNEQTLLAPYRASKFAGDTTTSPNLISTFQLTTSELMNAYKVNSQSFDMATFGSSTYVKLKNLTWDAAQAWAAQYGGHLVVPGDSAEQSFLASRFGGTQFWIGLTDRNHEGTWTTYDGVTAPSYTNWNTNEPNSGTNYDYGYQYTDGKWYDGWYTWTMDAVVEFDSNVDTDADGLPDPIDARPTDAFNGYDLRSAGPDGNFDTPDDVVYHVTASYDNQYTISANVTDGPLAPGHYRLSVTPSLTDVVGNALQPFTQVFDIAAIPAGYTFEGPNNNTMATATPLLPAESPAGSGYLVARARGSIDPANYQDWWNENDWYKVDLLAGDHISIAVDAASGSLNPALNFYGPTGNDISGVEDDGGPGANAFYSNYTIATSGTYYVRVGKYYWDTNPGDYDLRLDVARGITLEGDREYSNNSTSGATAVSYNVNGPQRTATAAGTIMAGQSGTVDQDYFDLGTMNAGETILLSLRLPTGSTLKPIVEIRNANNQVVSIATNPAAAVARADITTGGKYYALIIGAQGEGPLAQYLMDVAVQPTSSLDFADLTVSDVQQIPDGASGQLTTVHWTVGNYGAIATPGTTWADRIVVSKNNVYGDDDDIQVGVFNHTGALAVNQTYDAQADVRLPVGVSGDYYLFVATDSGNSVAEFIFESNNSTPAPGTFHIELTPYADLTVDSVTPPDRIIASGQFTASWVVRNAGAAATNNGQPGSSVTAWTDRLIISSNSVLGDADDRVIADVVRNGALAPDGTYTGSYTGSLPAGLNLAAGDYRFFVVTDVNDVVYEGVNVVSNSLGSSTFEVVPSPYVDLDPTTVSIIPNPASSGNLITINYTVINNGITGTTGTWSDRAYLSTDATFDGTDTLLGTFSRNDSVPAGQSYAKTEMVSLPERINGTYYVLIVTDSGNQLFEYKYETNNTEASPSLTVNRRPEADLSIAPANAPAEGTWGQQVTLNWTVNNTGPSDTRSNFFDRVYLSSDSTLDGADTQIVNVAGQLTAANNGTYTRSATFTLPSLAAGSWHLIWKTDATDAELEGNEANNLAVTDFTVHAPDLTALSVTPAGTSLVWGTDFNVTWVVKNLGDGSAVSNWNDGVYLSTDTTLDGSDRQLNSFLTPTTPLGAGSQYSNTQSLHTDLNWNLPPGTYYLIVKADVFGNRTESNENNNVIVSGPVTFALPALPDLTVDAGSIGIVQPSAKSGDTVTVKWTERNEGGAALATNTYTRVRITRVSDNSVVYDNAIFLSAADNAALTAGGTAQRQLNVNLPQGPSGAGTFNVEITADYYNQVFEYNGSGTGQTNNTSAGSFSATLAPYPDLTVTGLDTNPAAPKSGQSLAINYNLANSGSAPITTSFYYSINVVHVSTGQTLYSRVNLYDVAASGQIAAGSAKAVSDTFTLPDGALGTGDLAITVVADYYNQVFEYNGSGTGETNNTAQKTVTSTLADYPDLTVSGVTVASGTVKPGDQVLVTWTLTNSGNKSVAGPFSEKVFFSGDNAVGSDDLLKTVTFDGTLGAGQSIIRSAIVTVPQFAAGQRWLVVQTDSASQVFETNESNNASVSGTNVDIPLGLAVTTGQTQLVEGGAVSNVTISRNGPTTSALVVTLGNTNPGALMVPTTVTIPAGSSTVTFPVTPTDNNTVDGPRAATLSASAPGGYATGSLDFNVTDNDSPQLTVQLSPNPISEGEGAGSLLVRVFRNTGTTGDLTVHLSSSDPLRASVPATAVIPDGADHVDVLGDIKDNIYIDGLQSIGVTAAASGYQSGTDVTLFLDNDIPNLTLTAEQVTLSESAGAFGTTATITRSVPSPIDLYVQITGGSGQLVTPTFVKIFAFQTTASFTIGTLNNADVTGDRSVILTARVVDSFTKTPLESGKTSLTIKVTEDDGPVLTATAITPAIREDGQGTIRIRRNTGVTGDLPVTLLSSDTTELTVPATAIIPDGSDHVDVTVNGVQDGAIDGGQNATVSVSAFGFGGGSAVVSVTDADLPDLAVTAVTAPASGETGQTVTIGYTVVNQGVADVNGSWTDRVYVSDRPVIDDRATMVREFIRSGPMAVGGSYSNSVSVSLPSQVGSMYVIVVTDYVEGTTELREGNNTAASAGTNVVAAYTATVHADKDVYGAGQPVLLTGVATKTSNGQPAAFEFVKLHVLVNGTDRTLTAFTAADGSYQATWQPLTTEAGNYDVAATHPGVSNYTVQDSFSIAGMKAPSDSFTLTPFYLVTRTGQITNRSSIPITGIKATVSTLPDGMTLVPTIPDTLPANGAITISYQVQATNPDIGSGRVVIHLTSDQGATADIPVDISVVPLQASLVTTPGSLEAGMIRGERKTMDFTIKNNGSAPSGAITITLPNFPWMRLVSPGTLPSLEPGASATVTLELNPAADLPLLQYTGAIAINSANGASRALGFNFRALSLAQGDVQIDVVDEYTYYVDGAPKVAGATVRLSDPFDGHTIATGQTDDTGFITLPNVPEGSYQLEVYAPQHGTFRSRFDVVPGITNTKEVFIERQLVTYSWTVVPVDIQDTYKVTLQPTFETNVPVPVVTVSEPLVMPLVVEDEWTQFNITLTNHGLIAAKGVQIQLPDSPYFELRTLVAEIGDIPAKTTIQVPVQIRGKTGAVANQQSIASLEQAARASGTLGANQALSTLCLEVGPDIPCVPKLDIQTVYYFECGPDNKYHAVPVDVEPVCVAKDIYECLKQAWGTAAEALPSLGGNLANAPCALIDLILQCADTGLSDCQKALIKAACRGITGAIVGGPAGAAAGVGGAIGDLLSCLCDLFNFDFNIGDGGSVSGGGFGGGGYGGGYANPYGGGGGGSFATSGCSPSASSTSTDNSPVLLAPNADNSGVCAKVTLQIEQQAVLTRTGFAGTFTLENGTASDTLSGIRVDIDIRDSSGNPANYLFGFRDPEVTGMGNVSGTGVLAGTQKGTARYLFVPTRDAAPTTAQTYHIGGTLRYIDNGVEVVVPLIPATITVHPDPILTLDYFLQRDVYSDDPFTDPVEPSEPFSLGIIASNSGAGDARNFQIISGQPKIVENEKGLLIDFKIVGTQVKDQQVSPSLTANFGNILAGTSASAQWLMTSTLQGHFIDYKATFEHVDDFGNTRTSLIDAVNFHELEHALKVDVPSKPSDGQVDFLANDIPDPNKLPDMLYFSDGGKASVSSFLDTQSDAAVSPTHLTVHATSATVDHAGWSYLVFDDPGAGYVLKDVVRSDGTHLHVGDQAWTTDRIFGNEGVAHYVNQVHILDLNSTGSYTLVYGKPDEVAPTVTQVGPVTPNPRNNAVDSVVVAFSEKLADGSFDLSDVTLTRNNVQISIDGVATITKLDDTHYSIGNLAGLTGTAGDYGISVNAAGVQDIWANTGAGGVASHLWQTVPNVPVINSLGAGLSSVTNQAVGQVTVVFSKPVDPTSFTLADVTLKRNGTTIALSNPTTITQIDSTTFRIDALSGFDAAEGNYTLTVDAAGVTDLSANAGVGSVSTNWTVDTTAPTIVSVETLATSPRNIAVLSLDVDFSEPIDLATLSAADITLTLNGGADLFTSGLTWTQLTPTSLRLSGFTSVTGGQGTYVFTINGAGIADAAGNAVSNNLSTTWVMDTTAPGAPTNLTMTPDNGTSDTDGRTNVSTITLTGQVVEPGSVAKVVDLTTNTILGGATMNGTAFSKTMTFAAAGAHHLRVYAVDGAGNVSADAFFDLFIDVTKPTIQSVTGFGAANISVPVNELTVKFNKNITASSFTIADVTLTRDGTNVDLTGASVVMVDASTYKITGLTGATTALGTYVLAVNLPTINDDAGNVGDAAYSVQWTHVSAVASIGDFVFNDTNYNGMQDTGELGMAGVTVKLYSESNTLLATTSTDAAGHYLFDNLDADGRYYLVFAAPAGYGLTYANFANDLSDSDANQSTGQTDTFDIALGSNDSWDAGVVQLGSIGGSVYNDANNNHAKDPAEQALSGFTVFVDLNRNNQVDAGEPTTQTGADGSYVFANLLPGTYVVAMVVPAGWQQTTPDAQGVVVALHNTDVRAMANLSAANATPETPTDGFSAAEKLIGLDQLAADPRFSNLTGAGYTVAIIDTGIDLSNPFFGADADHDGIADRIVAQYDFGAGDTSAQDLAGHGTHIASIIGSSDSTYRGMATGVNFVVFKIFDDGGNAIFGQAEKALQWITAHANEYNILAVNMSFGDGRNWDWPSSTDCGCGNTVKRETYGLGDELATLRSMNVITSAAAGNNFYEVSGVQGMNYPAADPATISVGAVWDSDRGGSWSFSGTGAIDYTTDADRIASFSQRQSGYLDVFAPGAIITGAKVGGGVTTMQGTSQATAFVTGAAVLAQQLAIQHLGRRLTLAEFRTLLQTTGVTVLDGDNENDNVINSGQAYARLDVYAMANAIMNMSPGTPAPGTDPAGDPGDPPSTSGQGYAYQIAIAPGAAYTGANFGLRTANAPALELGNDPLQDKVVAGYTFHRDVPFTDADLTDNWTVTIDYGDGSAPVTTTTSTRLISLDHLYTHKGLYTISVTMTDDRGLTTADTMAFRVIPAVTGVRVNGDDGAQRSTVYKIGVDFAEPFAEGESLPTFDLIQRGGSAVTGYTVTRDATNPNTVWIDFGASASLADGIYDLTPIGAGFGASFASANGSGVKYSFHRLFGDLDGDRDVDARDLGTFRAVLNTSWAGFNAAKDGYDFNQDNSITRTPDYDAAYANLGKTLTYSSADVVVSSTSIGAATLSQRLASAVTSASSVTWVTPDGQEIEQGTQASPKTSATSTALPFSSTPIQSSAFPASDDSSSTDAEDDVLQIQSPNLLLIEGKLLQ